MKNDTIQFFTLPNYIYYYKQFVNEIHFHFSLHKFQERNAVNWMTTNCRTLLWNPTLGQSELLQPKSISSHASVPLLYKATTTSCARYDLLFSFKMFFLKLYIYESQKNMNAWRAIKPTLRIHRLLVSETNQWVGVAQWQNYKPVTQHLRVQSRYGSGSSTSRLVQSTRHWATIQDTCKV